MAALIARVFGAPSSEGRYASIDGLRGYLAFFVFLHHSSIWYYFVRTGQWKVPPSNLYRHFGESSVAMFFMITGFLFFSKLLEGRRKAIDWPRLFVSRFVRLAPLYALAMLLLMLIVAYLSGGALRQPPAKVLGAAVRWIGFSFLGEPDINGVVNTRAIMAVVTWTLPYEWSFYLCLPVLALTVRVVPPIPYLLLAAVSIAAAAIWKPAGYQVLWFGSGILAALLVRYEGLRSIATKPIGSALALACLAFAVVEFPTYYGAAPFVLLSVAFCLIAGGSSLFGGLTHPYSRILGDISYSVYLLHGITLFVLFKFVIGVAEASALSPTSHWMLIVLATPVLISICYFTFRTIEAPSMRSAPRVLSWARSAARLSHSPG